MEIAGVAASLESCAPILADERRPVLLLDLRLGDESGFDILPRAAGRMPRWWW